MIGIVDYGLGNLRSVEKAFASLHCQARISADPDSLRKFDRLVLPGVGSFGQASRSLVSSGLMEAVKDYAKLNRPLLGICLGMQLLADAGEEGGQYSGLGLIPGRVEKLVGEEKLPHVGWNRLRFQHKSVLLEGIEDGSHMYFVHSYGFKPKNKEYQKAAAYYGEDFCALIEKDQVYGVQFHPEKSSTFGLQLLENFAKRSEQA